MAETNASGDSPVAGENPAESAEAAATRSSRVLIPRGAEPEPPPREVERPLAGESVDGTPVMLGGAAAVSGLVLMFWYRPEPALAVLSLLDFEAMSPLRWLRGVHFWAAVGLLVWGGFRLLELAGEKAYRRPWPGRWWGGLALLAVLGGCVASGVLLVGDAVALRAWGLLGAAEPSESTWRGVYVLHCVVPFGLAFWLLRRRGGSGR
jgi:hypothetical protein